MKKVIIVLFIFSSVFNGVFSQESNLLKSKILILYGKNYDQNTKYNILNLDNSLFTTIESNNGNEPSCDTLTNQILAYFPDYYMFHFYLNEYNNNEGYYHVKIGNENKLIKMDTTMIVLSLKEYFNTYYCKTSSKNPLHTKPDKSSKFMNLDYNNLYFKCICINENWMKVESVNTDETIPVNQYVGWLMWNKDGKIIIEYPYIY